MVLLLNLLLLNCELMRPSLTCSFLHHPQISLLTLSVKLLNDKFGTADDLKSLVSALHARDMYIMIDVVVNNIAATTSSFTPDYSSYLFSSAEYYHPYAAINWGNTTSEQVGYVHVLPSGRLHSCTGFRLPWFVGLVFPWRTMCELFPLAIERNDALLAHPHAAPFRPREDHRNATCSHT